MKDSIRDRLRITKRGKVLRRALALGHARVNKSARQMLRKRGARGLNLPRKIMRKYM